MRVLSKILLSTFLFLLISNVSFSNIYLNDVLSSNMTKNSDILLKKTFAKDLTEYTKAINEKNWDKLEQMTYPKLFTVVAKETLIGSYELLSIMGDITTKLNSVDKVSKVVSSKEEKFCKLWYDATLTIKLNMIMAQAAPMCKEQLESKFGKENVSYDEANTTFTIKNKRTILAISPKKISKWKYLDVDSKGTSKVRKLIPEGILSKLEK
ncbi:MAG: hypothetical protein N4A49_09760 [Marinifilaceae bacterium]|jgi:hypothetical protein|nr:hypothetical protein [Marinifilaceae bacterium]